MAADRGPEFPDLAGDLAIWQACAEMTDQEHSRIKGRHDGLLRAISDLANRLDHTQHAPVATELRALGVRFGEPGDAPRN